MKPCQNFPVTGDILFLVCKGGLRLNPNYGCRNCPAAEALRELRATKAGG